MICIICRNSFLANEIKSICNANAKDEVLIINNCNVFTLFNSCNIRLVFFDTDIFIDTAPLRIKSPNTKFIAIAQFGNELKAEKAMMCGASDFLLCPFDENGVVRYL